MSAGDWLDWMKGYPFGGTAQQIGNQQQITSGSGLNSYDASLAKHFADQQQRYNQEQQKMLEQYMQMLQQSYMAKPIELPDEFDEWVKTVREKHRIEELLKVIAKHMEIKLVE